MVGDYNKRFKESTVTIYSLAHPITNEIFYVGRTTRDLESRLRDHLCANKHLSLSKRIKAMRKQTGSKPVIEYLDTTTYNMRREIEEYWIQQLSSWGFVLFNVRHYKNKNFIPFGKRIKRRSSLTNEERELVTIMHRHGDNDVIAKMLGVSNELVRIYSKNKTIPVWYKEAVIKFYSERATKIAEWHNKQKTA